MSLPVDPEPVLLELRQHHRYRSKGKGTRGCATCNQAKAHIDHLGPPPSYNALGGRTNFDYETFKPAVQQLVAERLDDLAVPRGFEFVLVEGCAVFPDRCRRDQGNHRVILEKAVGDALAHGSPAGVREQFAGGEVAVKWADRVVEGGWLEDDDWDRYEFGRLEQRFEPGVAGVDLMFFPRAAAALEVAA